MDQTSFNLHAKAWQCIEDFESAREPELVREARKLALRNDVPQCTASQGSLLSSLVHMQHAESIIVVGTSPVVETAQLVEALDNHGKVTVVDSTADGIRILREFIAEAADETHTIMRAANADPSRFLQRLTPDDYDLIVVCGNTSNYEQTLAHAASLLHHGGAIVFTDALAFARRGNKGGLTNAADRSEQAVTMRNIIEQLQDDDRFTSSLNPAGTGLLIAVKR
ncbi:O-methyltransferase [Bifidobacterium dolichotidis]|uniref:O-methyltransferase n=1 Tax=Bifidobacterium dolichotidis TaxID=2306976 RepID=A0A430FSI1_9BIFI|nr:methyltransferase [Bifidobacterium dolichotidis]RSX55810.1 O-methyltransferase [Bifidobacterium dolichotidis]